MRDVKYMYIKSPQREILVQQTDKSETNAKNKKKNVFKEKSERIIYRAFLSIPQSRGKNVKTSRWDHRLQRQNLFMAFKRVSRW